MKNKTLQEVYKNSSDEVKEILKSKFSSNDLGIESVETQIRNEILEIIRKNIKNIRFLDENGDYIDLPSQRFEIINENDEWLFDINYDEETKDFYYSYYRIYRIFESKYEVNRMKFNEIMRGVVEEDLKMIGVTPAELFLDEPKKVEEDLKMIGVTPWSISLRCLAMVEEDLKMIGVTPYTSLFIR